MGAHLKRQRPPTCFEDVRTCGLTGSARHSFTGCRWRLRLLSLLLCLLQQPGPLPVRPKPIQWRFWQQHWRQLRGGPGSGSNTRQRRCRGGKGGGQGAGQAWPSFYDPWTGTIQMWPGPWPPNSAPPRHPAQQQPRLGPAHQQAFLAAQTAPAPLQAPFHPSYPALPYPGPTFAPSYPTYPAFPPLAVPQFPQLPAPAIPSAPTTPS